MLAVEITDGPPPCTCDHQAVVLSCSNLARRWVPVALELRSASWLVVDTLVKACSRETHITVPAGHLKHGHNAFQIIHIHTLLNTDCH